MRKVSWSTKQMSPTKRTRALNPAQREDDLTTGTNPGKHAADEVPSMTGMHQIVTLPFCKHQFSLMLSWQFNLKFRTGGIWVAGGTVKKFGSRL